MLHVGARRGKWSLTQKVEGAERSSWICVCECGTRRVVRADHLTMGRSRSCGCGQSRVHTRIMNSAFQKEAR